MILSVQSMIAENVAMFEDPNPLTLIPAFAVVWFLIRQALSLTPIAYPGRVVGILHALFTVFIGYPIMAMIVENSFTDHSVMFESMMYHRHTIVLIAQLCCCASAGYFIMDSFYIYNTPYLKHHLGAVAAWACCLLTTDICLTHGVVMVSIFETGAILVQCSRAMKQVLWFRTFICLGYTCTRLTLFWYWAFTAYTCMVEAATSSWVFAVLNIPMHSSVLFLLALNAKWAFLQWKALVRAYSAAQRSEKTEDFFVYHQKILGAASSSPSSVAAA